MKRECRQFFQSSRREAKIVLTLHTDAMMIFMISLWFQLT